MMIRLLLVLSAAACCLGGVAASEILSTMLPMIRNKATWDGSLIKKSSKNPFFNVSKLVVLLGIGLLFHLLKGYVTHCTWMSA